jgi:hypothetical protein
MRYEISYKNSVLIITKNGNTVFSKNMSSFAVNDRIQSMYDSLFAHTLIPMHEIENISETVMNTGYVLADA